MQASFNVLNYTKGNALYQLLGSVNNTDDNVEEVSELSLFTPTLDASVFFYLPIIYFIFYSIVKSKWLHANTSQSLENPNVTDENEIQDETHDPLFLDLDKEAIAGNWEFVENSIRLGAKPSTLVLCLAFTNDRDDLVYSIIRNSGDCRVKIDYLRILSDQDCHPLVDIMIEQDLITEIDGKLFNLACRFGHLPLIRHIMGKIDVKIRLKHLNLAILSGDYQTVIYFIQDLKVEPGENSLELACYSRNLYLVRYLEENFGDNVDYPTLQAVIYDWKVLRYFVEERDYPISHFMFRQTAFYGYFDSFEFLEKFYTFQPDIFSLDNACFSGNLNLVKYLIEERNIEPSMFNLDSAAINGQVQVVRYLIDQRNLTHDHLVEDNAALSNNMELIAFLSRRQPRIYHWFYLWEYYWFRRWSHTKLLKSQKAIFTGYQEEMRKLSLISGEI